LAAFVGRDGSHWLQLKFSGIRLRLISMHAICCHTLFEN
jgi:hypothetical protein